MKFAYIDESGSSGEGDVFVMAGLLIDAHRLRQQTYRFDNMLHAFLSRYPTIPTELKTKPFINGNNRWSAVPFDERKIFLMNVCQLARSIANIYGFSLSFDALKNACEQNPQLPIDKHYWPVSGMFICSLIQKHMQKIKSHKGLSVLIFDDNKKDMPKISKELYKPNPWFDGLYQKKNKKNKWVPPKTNERFQHIINTAFAIKSEHSSFIQMADAICYVYRRWLELFTEQESWEGEKAFYSQLVGILDTKRKHLGTPSSECVDFYNSIKHPNWAI